MLALFLLLALAAIAAMTPIVAAQADHAIHGFEYFGCVNITSDKFGAFVSFPTAYIPEQCQSACTGFEYAAAFPDDCRCGRNIESSLCKVDDSFCSSPCNGDASLGYCGFSSSSGCSYANVYHACAEFPAAPTPPDSAPTTYTTVRLPTVTRTLKLATKATVVVHTVTQGNVVTSCPLDHDHTTVPEEGPSPGAPPPGAPSPGAPSPGAPSPIGPSLIVPSPVGPSPVAPSTEPAVVVQTVVVNVPPNGSPNSPGLQGYGSIPPVATAPPSAPNSPGLSPTTLVPYADPPVPSSPSNATITTSSPEGPQFRTILPEDPATSATVVVPAVVTTAQAHRVNAGIAGVIAAAVVAAGI